MRLIDADTLPRHGKRGGLVYWRDIENAQTVDAEPVRHGKWIEDEVDRWRCSECNKGNRYAYSWDSTRGDIIQDHFCPYCGAKMYKEEDDE